MKYLPSIIAVLGVLATTFAPQLQHLISLHPEAGVIIGGLYAILSHIWPPPQGK